MGDININHKKDLEAAESNFQLILETEPENVQARHNLCVVYVERGDLYKAEKCLADVLEIAPREEYIRQHLGIVRNRIARVQQHNREKAAQAGKAPQNGKHVQQDNRGET